MKLLRSRRANMQIFIPNMFKNVRNLTNSNGSNNNHNSTNRRLSIVDCFRSSSNKIHHVYRDSFHRAVYPIILVAQVFSLMPVEGISAANATFLRFKFYSIRTIYSCVFTVLAFLILAFEIYRVKNNNDATAKNLAGAVFFSATTAIHILFIYIAKRWKEFMMGWAENEAVFLKHPYFHHQKRRLRSKIYRFGAIFWILALIEHLLSRGNNYYNFSFEIRYCNLTVDNNFEFYSLKEYGHILFSIIPYHWTISLFLFIFHGVLTFSWNFPDLFIVNISFGLAERYRQMNEHLLDIYQNQMSEMENIEFWKRVRFHYGLICEIVESFNVSLSSVIILSCLNNLYFICLQVLNVTIPLPHTINFIYFWFSLGFLIMRTVSVFLSSAEVNEQAIKPLEIIRHLPNAYWNIEVERLANQIRCETVALSGMKFFNMTRRLLFGMLGTIITYEIVLMQFDTSDQKPIVINCSELIASYESL